MQGFMKVIPLGNTVPCIQSLKNTIIDIILTVYLCYNYVCPSITSFFQGQGRSTTGLVKIEQGQESSYCKLLSMRIVAAAILRIFHRPIDEEDTIGYHPNEEDVALSHRNLTDGVLLRNDELTVHDPI